MASKHFISLGTIKGKDGLLVALKHNKRVLQNERGAPVNINAAKMHLNYSLTGDGTPEEIALHAKVQMLSAGLEKARKGGVMAVEIVFSLPIDRHIQDTRQFFIDCL